MKTWHLVGIAGIIFIIGLLLGELFLNVRSITDEYKIFRDIFTFVLAMSALAIAVFTTIGYKVLSEKLQQEVTIKAKTEGYRYMCELYTGLSYLFWKHYEIDYEIGGKLKSSERHYLDTAIEQAEVALNYTKFLDEKKDEEVICLAKNNLAYHLAMREWPDDSRRAIALAKYVYDKIESFDYEKVCDLTETYCFVLIKLGNEQQKKEGVEIIKGLSKRDDLSTSLKKNIEIKYKGIL